MFVTDFTIIRSGEIVGMLRFDGQGFSVPHLPDLRELLCPLTIKGHEVTITDDGGRTFVRINPHDMTKNMVLRSIKQRLTYSGFVLEPHQ